MKTPLMLALLVCLPLATAAGNESINKVNRSVHVDTGEHVGHVSTVNGSIEVEDDATRNLTAPTGSTPYGGRRASSSGRARS